MQNGRTATQPAGPPIYAQNLKVVSRFTVHDVPRQVYHVVMLLGFPPRAWTAVHVPGGDMYNTVYEGEISIRQADGADKHFAAGDNFVEFGGEWLSVGNDRILNLGSSLLHCSLCRRGWR
jgi:hypothetical protein